jgi:hypothetical protein
MKYLIILFFLSVQTLTTELFAQSSEGTIIGIVEDEVTKEPIPGVNIFVIGTNLGAATNIEGEFRITNLEIGSYQIKVSAIGYNTLQKSDIIINSARPTSVLIQLTQSFIELEGVTVKSGYFEMDPSEIGSIANLNYEEIRRTPGGFEDVVRALRYYRVLLRQVPEEMILLSVAAHHQKIYIWLMALLFPT